MERSLCYGKRSSKQKRACRIIMESQKTKKHQHKYDKLADWIKSPSHLDDASRYWNFSVKRACSCGATYVDEATLDEVKQYIYNNTCEICGDMGTKHRFEKECIKNLHLRVKFLEDRLEKVCNALV